MPLQYPHQAAAIIMIAVPFRHQVAGRAVCRAAGGRRDFGRDRTRPAGGDPAQARSPLADFARQVDRPECDPGLQHADLWTAMVWASFNSQSQCGPSAPILRAGPYLLALFPLLAVDPHPDVFHGCAAPVRHGLAAILIMALSWFDGIFNALGNQCDVDDSCR